MDRQRRQTETWTDKNVNRKIDIQKDRQRWIDRKIGRWRVKWIDKKMD